jgi:transposase InsO family protein
MWHIDTTVIRLLDGTRAYLHAVIDNFSRRILAWRPACLRCGQTLQSEVSPEGRALSASWNSSWLIIAVATFLILLIGIASRYWTAPAAGQRSQRCCSSRSTTQPARRVRHSPRRPRIPAQRRQ